MTSPLEFHLPDVGEGIAEVQVLQWFAEVGETVQADRPLIEVETDKSIVEIPAPITGILVRRGIETGSVGRVGDLLAVIDGESTGAPGPPPVEGTAESMTLSPAAAQATAVAQSPARGPERRAIRRPLASPHTRRLAAHSGIDLATITGTGPHGRIVETDLDSVLQAEHSGPASRVEAAAQITPAATSGVTTPTTRSSSSRPRTSETTKLTGVRWATAQAMTRTLTIPHITEFRQVDATNLIAARTVLKNRFADRGLTLSVLTLLLAAVIRALVENPSFNATFDESTATLTKFSAVDLGIATATDDGLLVPVMRDADERGLAEITAELNRLSTGARARSLGRDELTSGTFTVTNFGSFGTWLGSPLIRPPEVGIAGFGRINDTVIAVDGQAVVRPVLPIVVAADHRVHDGAHVAAFVDSIAAVVTQPLVLLS